MKKKLWLLLSLVLCMTCFVSCGNSKDTGSEVDSDIVSTCVSSTEENFKTWNETDFATSVDLTTADDDMKDKYNQWITLQKELGDFVSQSETETDVTDDAIVCTIEGKYEYGKTSFKATFDTSGTFQDLSVDEVYTKAQTMERALLNTLMGMGTVFIVLIVMSLILGGFGKIFVNKGNKKKTETPVPAAAPVAVRALDVREPEEVTDDLELVAVVTAAIMASLGEEAPAEGLVVRSIRKRNVDQWKNA